MRLAGLVEKILDTSAAPEYLAIILRRRQLEALSSPCSNAEMLSYVPRKQTSALKSIWCCENLKIKEEG